MTVLTYVHENSMLVCHTSLTLRCSCRMCSYYNPPFQGIDLIATDISDSIIIELESLLIATIWKIFLFFSFLSLKWKICKPQFWAPFPRDVRDGQQGLTCRERTVRLVSNPLASALLYRPLRFFTTLLLFPLNNKYRHQCLDQSSNSLLPKLWCKIYQRLENFPQYVYVTDQRLTYTLWAYSLTTIYMVQLLSIFF